MKKEKSFTLFEILIGLSIFALLSVTSILILYPRFRGNVLENTKQKIIWYLEFARERSISQYQGENWGVYFNNPSSGDSFFALFYGTSYSSSHEEGRVYLPEKVEFFEPSDGSTKEIVFEKITGFLKSGSDDFVTIYLKESPTQTKTINVNPKGKIGD